MAITVNSRQEVKTLKGMEEKYGLAFSTTDASGTITLGGMKVIESASFGIVGTPAADEVLSLNEATHMSQGKIIVSAGVIVITRTGASKTSGLQFFLRIEGY